MQTMHLDREMEDVPVDNRFWKGVWEMGFYCVYQLRMDALGVEPEGVSRIY